MGKKKKKQLTQAEIWDDSALLQSWDEALEEYKLYHSIHARGERVEDVLKAAEMPEIEIDETDPSTPAAIAQSNSGNDEDVEDGELMDETGEQGIDTNTTTDQPMATTQESPSSKQPAPNGAPVQSTGTTKMPDPVLAGVQDEAMKNLMMSWYYAGYYTGLYEGQQIALQN